MGVAPPGALRLGYRPALDGLRAVAILLVIAYHDGLIVGGFVGVDVFFALSGFLITSLLLEEWQGRGSIDLQRFYARRILRLAPALTVFVAVVYAATHWAVPALAGALEGRWAVAALFYFTNILIAYGGEYPIGLVSICWSLALEEQFYLMWPAVLRALLRGGMSWRGLTATLAALIAGSNVLRLALARRGGDDLWLRIYFGPDTRADAILVGCLLAVVMAWRGAAPAANRRTEVGAFLAAAAAIAWVAGYRHIADTVAGPGLFAVVAAASTVVVFEAARGGRVTSALGWAPLVWIGRLSYSLYLWHVVGLQLGAGLGRAASYAIIAILAATSYFFVEGPFLALKARLRAGKREVGDEAVGGPGARAAALRIAAGVAVLLGIVGGGLEWKDAVVARYFSLGEKALARDDFGAAADAYGRALAFAPARADIHHQIGVAHALRGEFAAAVHHLEEAERLYPTPEGRADLARAREDLRKAGGYGPKLAPRGLD